MDFDETKRVIAFFMEGRKRKNYFSRVLLEICLPFGLLYALYIFTDNVISEKFVIFSIMIRNFAMSSQIVLDVNSKNMLGIYENLACTRLDIKQVVSIEAITAFLTDLGSTLCFSLTNWLVFFFLLGKEKGAIFYIVPFIMSIILNLLFSILTSYISTIRGMRFDTAGLFPFCGMAVSILTLFFSSFFMQIAVAWFYAIVLCTILWVRLKKLSFESFGKY